MNPEMGKDGLAPTWRLIEVFIPGTDYRVIFPGDILAKIMNKTPGPEPIGTAARCFLLETAQKKGRLWIREVLNYSLS